MSLSEIFSSLTEPAANDAQQRAIVVVLIAGMVALVLIVFWKIWQPKRG